MLLLDGKMRLTATVARGVHGSGRLSLANAKNFNDFFKRKRGIVQIENKDRLCLPRAIVVGRACIQHYDKNSLSNYEYRCIVGSKKSHADRQCELAKELCVKAGIQVEEYNNGVKIFGMEEVKLFAQLLAPKHGIAVHNSHTANSKVFETSTAEDQKIVSWINLLNLADHFNLITKPAGFFGTDYWCELCNKYYHDKLNHRCIPNCVACKTLETENCDFKHGKTMPCNDCH